MATSIVLFTRDLRVRDHPALRAALSASEVIVPMFVLDPAIDAPPNRLAFLLDCLRDLDASLRSRGGRLIIRRGDTANEVATIARRVAASTVYLSGDVSAYAARRTDRLRAAGLHVEAHPGVTIVPPGDVRPSSGAAAFSVFTPYFRKWIEQRWRTTLAAPRRIAVPDVAGHRLPRRPAETSPRLPEGGETAGRRRMTGFLRSGLERYEERRDILAADGTSGLSPYLHFGCVSPLELAARADHDGFVRQLCWRDFHHQLLAARPELVGDDMHPGRRRWRDDPDGLERWKAGETGVPLVDAGMRQLLGEGLMHNRVRMVVASYLTKTLDIDWREGAAHFAHWLVDADLANNIGNWQWVAGVGADTRPNRVLNPERQAKRFDPDGSYVSRWLG